MSKSNFDDFKKLADKIRVSLTGKGSQPSLNEYVCNELTAQALKEIRQNTPVVTGRLRRGWTHNMEVKASDIPEYARSQVPKVKTGEKTTQITMSNNVDYAPYVENGHRTVFGGWSEGRFMAKRSLEHMGNFGSQLLEVYLTDYFDRYM